jgi:hypothetical protein
MRGVQLSGRRERLERGLVFSRAGRKCRGSYFITVKLLLPANSSSGAFIELISDLPASGERRTSTPRLHAYVPHPATPPTNAADTTRDGRNAAAAQADSRILSSFFKIGSTTLEKGLKKRPRQRPLNL